MGQQSGCLMSFLALMMRWALGLYFLLSGLGTINYVGMDNFVSVHFVNLADDFPYAFAKYYLLCMPFLELLLGAMLMVGLFSRLAAFALIFVMYTYFAGVGNPDSLPFVQYLSHGSEPMHPHLILLMIVSFVICVGSGSASMDRVLFGRRKVHAVKLDDDVS